MDAMARETESVVSAVLFGALAGSGALPFARDAYEETIRRSGRAVEANLAGFAKGLEAGAAPDLTRSEAHAAVVDEPRASVSADAALFDRIHGAFPAAAHFALTEGIKKLIDYQDPRYATLYLGRMDRILEADAKHGGERRGWLLTKETARSLALWMAFDDTIRVADLKTRKSRFVRSRDDVKALPQQIIHVREYLHPRVEEICDLTPAPIGRFVLSTPPLRNLVAALFGHGRRVSTTKLRGFLLLNFIGSLKPMRRMSYRYKIEDARINSWLQRILNEAPAGYRLACEIAEMQRLIKGYGETHERGLSNFNKILDLIPAVKAKADPAAAINQLVSAALADDEGRALSAALQGCVGRSVTGRALGKADAGTGRHGLQAERKDLHGLPGHRERVELLVATVEHVQQPRGGRLVRLSRRKLDLDQGEIDLHLMELPHVAKLSGSV